MNYINIGNFSKKYGDFLAVDNISFQVKSGQITGFAGKNGAGKSTTLLSIINILHPTSGKITINGYDSIKDARQIKNFTSYMPSESFFPEKISAQDAFEFICKLNNYSIDNAYKLAEYFELDINKTISELSLGNRKKVSIIQSFLSQADIFIFDEPTGGLDPYMQEKFFHILKERAENGAAVLLSSHNLNDIEKYCTNVIIIKDGKIVDNINMAELASSKEYKITYTTKDDKTITYAYNDDINKLIKELSNIELKSLEIKKESVEDDFAKYYNK